MNPVSVLRCPFTEATQNRICQIARAKMPEAFINGVPNRGTADDLEEFSNDLILKMMWVCRCPNLKPETLEEARTYWKE